MLPDSNGYRLLYTDEFGDDVGLDEVQLIDPPIEDRIPQLIELINNPDPFISYQSVLILTAWGVEEGIDELDKLLLKPDLAQHEFSLNRFTGEDNVYDDLSYAVYLFGLSGGKRSRMLTSFKNILQKYPHFFFESKLKHALLKNQFTELILELERVAIDTLSNGRVYQASQLLPVISKMDPNKGWELINTFLGVPDVVPSPMANVAEALKYMSASPERRDVLDRCLESTAPGVAEEARKSLQAWS